MGNLKAVVPIALSLVIAVVGSFFLYNWVQKRTAPKEIVRVEADAVPVAVAAANLVWGTQIKPEMVKTVPYLKESLPTGYFAKIDDLKDRVLIADQRPHRGTPPRAEGRENRRGGGGAQRGQAGGLGEG